MRDQHYWLSGLLSCVFLMWFLVHSVSCTTYVRAVHVCLCQALASIMGQGLPSLYNDRLSTLGDVSTRIDDQHAMSDDSDDDQKEKKSKKVKKDKPEKKEKKKKNADEVPVTEAGLCYALSLHSPFVLVCVRRSRSQTKTWNR